MSSSQPSPRARSSGYATPGVAVLVRRATATDLPQLIELRWASSIEDDVAREPRPAFETKMRAFLERAVEDPRWVIWVASDGDPVASISLGEAIGG